MSKLIFTGGGTAGHVIPNLSIYSQIKNNVENVYYFGSPNCIEKEIITKTNIPYYPISCVKLNRQNLLKNFKIPFELIKGINQAGKLLDEIKPDLIFSKGGYVSLPTIIAGKKRKIPIIAHESDYSLGVANKITLNFCDKMLTSFEETAKSIKKGLYVGPPIRQTLFNLNKSDSIKYFGLNGKKPILLAVGGSQGASTINNLLRNNLEKLLTFFDVIHICGKNNIQHKLNYNGYKQYEYLDKIEYAFNVADVCISRAGSNALFEILSLKIPCLAIPLPKGNSRGDQVLNAKYFYKKGLLNMIEQDNLTNESFLLAIYSTYNSKQNIINNLNKYPITNGITEIVKILSEYL